MPRKPLPVSIVWMVKRDMHAVLEIESASFDHPWTLDDFARHTSRRNTIGMVAEHDTGAADRVVGYMVYELHKSKIEVLNFAVAPDCRRRGVGSAMVAKLVSKLDRERSRIALHIKESNLGGQLFWKAAGFRAQDVVRGYYPCTGEDAYRFVFHLPQIARVSPAGATEW